MTILMYDYTSAQYSRVRECTLNTHVLYMYKYMYIMKGIHVFMYSYYSITNNHSDNNYNII